MRALHFIPELEHGAWDLARGTAEPIVGITDLSDVHAIPAHADTVVVWHQRDIVRVEPVVGHLIPGPAFLREPHVREERNDELRVAVGRDACKSNLSRGRGLPHDIAAELVACPIQERVSERLVWACPVVTERHFVVRAGARVT